MPGQEFSPDWTIPPAASLRVWMRDREIPFARLVAMCSPVENRELVEFSLRTVMNKGHLTVACAHFLETGTGVPARFWLSLERGYQNDLAAGRVDYTPNSLEG